jgi:hypothetical protein
VWASQVSTTRTSWHVSASEASGKEEAPPSWV